MPHATPFLLFDGNCAEAMTFYHRCLGGELTMTPLGTTPMKESFPSVMHDRLINAHLTSGEIEISAADWMAADFEPVRGNMSAIYVTGPSADDLRPAFDALRDGDHNSRLQELHEMPFGTYGQFYDKFDVQWIFVGQGQGDGDRETA